MFNSENKLPLKYNSLGRMDWRFADINSANLVKTNASKDTILDRISMED